MADDFARAFAAPPPPPPRPHTRVARSRKPGVWARWPTEVPRVVQAVNDLAVEHLVLRPIERVDRKLAEARARVDALAAAAEALRFRPR